MLPHDELGSGPAVVLLHAGIADRTMWAEHLEPMARAGYRVVAVDLPGFGEAPVAAGHQAPWTDVLDTLADLAVERAALVGNSFGGAVALRAAFVAPERVWALAMISAPSPGLEASPELEAAWQAEEKALERGDTEEAVGAVVDAWMLPDAPPELRHRVAVMQRRAFALQAGVELAEAPDPVEQDPDALARLQIPTLVAAGERDKPDFLEAAREMARTLPVARHTVIADAGHLAPLETPESFRRLLLDFLRFGVASHADGSIPTDLDAHRSRRPPISTIVLRLIDRATSTTPGRGRTLTGPEHRSTARRDKGAPMPGTTPRPRFTHRSGSAGSGPATDTPRSDEGEDRSKG